MAKSIAHQKLETQNPGTMEEASKTSIALMTSVKRPRVKMFMGSVRKIRIGFKIALIAPSTTAKTKAITKLSTKTPGKTYEAIAIATAEKNQLKINCIEF